VNTKTLKLEYSSLDVADLGTSAAGIPAPEPPLRPRTIRPAGSPPVIRVCEPLLAGNEERYLVECVRRNWVSSAGPFVRRFEQMFGEYCGTDFAVACSSGTASLQLALYSLGITEGDEVLMPSFTMVAVPNTVRHCRATPVFVDSDPQTWNIDPSAVPDAITPRTKAIVAVHTYGHPAPMDEIMALADAHGLFVVEDAAEAQGALYHSRRVGGIGDCGCFSFYANKIITTGEGGMLTTDDEELAWKARNVRDHAFSEERHFWHKVVGYNFRMTNLQAAIGVAQMERVEQLLQQRVDHARRYHAKLKDVPGLRLPSQAPGVVNVHWMYSILVTEAFGATRDRLRRHLANHGIETRSFFIPMHLQPIYHRPEFVGRFPVAERLCRQGLYLPSGAGLREEEIDFVCAQIKELSR
jgi:perosamine synthetase